MSVIQVQTHVRCDNCGAEAPPAAGIMRARQLARELGWKADGSRNPDVCERCLALEEYRKLIRRVGPGFHPDTPFEQYDEALQLSMSAMYYERTVSRVFAMSDIDPYGIALDVIHELDKEVQ